MQKVTVQIPVSKELKISAEAAALEYGFSSLQEILRVIMKKLASKTMHLTFEEEGVVYLSKKNEKRYEKMMRDIESGKEKLYTAKNVDDFIKQLNA